MSKPLHNMQQMLSKACLPAALGDGLVAPRRPAPPAAALPAAAPPNRAAARRSFSSWAALASAEAAETRADAGVVLE